MPYIKRLLLAILAGGLLSGGSMALGQDTTSQNSGAAQPGSPLRIVPGSVIPVELTKSIDAKKVKVGDEVMAQVAQDMKANGEVIVPKGTKIVGHVTEAQPRSKEQKESEIGIAFDHAVMKNGSDLPIPLSIQAIIAPPSANGGGYDQPGGSGGGGSPGYSGGTGGGMGGGRMGGGTPTPPSNMPSSARAPADAPNGSGTHDGSGAPSGSGGRPAITGDTQGVVGISNLKLIMVASNPSQGSLVSSEKNNVKLESGTFMLLRVNQ
jgi:hypothetical protein